MRVIFERGLRDWLVITVRGGGRYKMGKSRSETFCTPLLKSGNFLHPPSIWLRLQAICTA